MTIEHQIICVLLGSAQCDQIWRFIELWATFKSFWQQLIAQIFHVLREFL